MKPSLDTDNEMMHFMPEPSRFVWVTEFNQQSAHAFYRKFLSLEKSEEIEIIPVFINSYGGELFALTSMRDLIRSCPKPVATIAVGMAMSCGASLLACGTKGFRFASEDCQILIHQVSGGALGKASDIAVGADHLKKMNDKLLDNLAKDTGRSRKTFEKQISKRNNADWIMSAQEAVQWSMVDHVGIPRMVPEAQPMRLASATSYDELLKQMTRKPPKSGKRA